MGRIGRIVGFDAVCRGACSVPKIRAVSQSSSWKDDWWAWMSLGPKGLPIPSFNELVPSDESSEAVMFPIAGYSYEFTSVYSLREVEVGYRMKNIGPLDVLIQE